jgi:hypothetical protein
LGIECDGTHILGDRTKRSYAEGARRPGPGRISPNFVNAATRATRISAGAIASAGNTTARRFRIGSASGSKRNSNREPNSINDGCSNTGSGFSIFRSEQAALDPRPGASTGRQYQSIRPVIGEGRSRYQDV